MSQSLRHSHVHVTAFLELVQCHARRAARALNARSPWLGAQLRRAILLVKWTLTGQLHVHARYWLRARRLRRAAPAVAATILLPTIDARTLAVPLADDPVVSIIIPTYGQVDFTLRCLASLIEYAPDIPVEVIVVDDAWTGADSNRLSAVTGIRLIRNNTNLGFLRSCNKAAAAARGRFLCFLNNDTQVQSNWLAPMLSLLANRADVGAVGAKLLNPDGRLQEAGGIIWRDGSGWNFGRDDDPDNPVYNYVREVDYCSGAALMVNRDVFMGIGGFDERYAPAYYEDADLSFRLRRIGLKTLYQPASRVVHFEGVSHGRDVTSGIKSYQVLNGKKFVAIWGKVLADQHLPNGQNVLRARDRAVGRPLVLVVDHYVPQPDRDAGSRTIMGFLRVMVQAGMVVKFWPQNLSYSPGYTEALQAMGIEVFHGRAQMPFARWIQEFGNEFDCIILSRPDVATHFIEPIRQHSKARLVYYGHDLHFLRMRRQGMLMQDEQILQSAERMERLERSIWQQVDLSLYPSTEEADIAAALRPDLRFAAVVPYAFSSFPSKRHPPASSEIIFVGGFAHAPNEDAACWFVTDVLPLIRAQCGETRLSIIGSNPSTRVRSLENDVVSIFANVSDGELAQAYARARVAVVPLRCGAGVKLKVVEALQTGLPVVTTSVGIDGLPGAFRVVSVEQQAEDFAAAVITLLRDDDTWITRSTAQVAFAAKHFSISAMSSSLVAALNVPELAALH